MSKLVKESLNEGAWGSFPLDNDSASDWKWEFGDVIIDKLKEKLDSQNQEEALRFDDAYHAIGMWEFFKDKLKTQYSFFSDDEIEEMDNLTKEVAQKLLDSGYGKDYKEPEKVQTYLQNYINQIED